LQARLWPQRLAPSLRVFLMPLALPMQPVLPMKADSMMASTGKKWMQMKLMSINKLSTSRPRVNLFSFKSLT
jgi:hypothetical protein